MTQELMNHFPVSEIASADQPLPEMPGPVPGLDQAAIKPEDILSFSSAMGAAKLDALFTELCVPWWVDSEGKKRVVPKLKLKKDLGVKSHNLADAVIAADNVNITGPTVAMFLRRKHR